MLVAVVLFTLTGGQELEVQMRNKYKVSIKVMEFGRTLFQYHCLHLVKITTFQDLSFIVPTNYKNLVPPPSVVQAFLFQVFRAIKNSEDFKYTGRK